MFDEPITVVLPRQAHNLLGARQGTWEIVSLVSAANGLVVWLARCDCGREKKIRASNWRTGKCTQTCACIPKVPNYNQLPDGESSFNTLHYGYIKRAEKRGLSWELTRDEFRAFTKKPCTYCGCPPSQVRNTTRKVPGYIYNGVDRIDPAGGYTPDNVTACCGACNRAKSDLSPTEWREQIKRLAERLGSW